MLPRVNLDLSWPTRRKQILVAISFSNILIHVRIFVRISGIADLFCGYQD